MRNLSIIISLFFLCMETKAQTIQGKVTDDSNQPVDFATIVLQTIDSVYVASTYTDSLGRFSLQSDLDHYRLIVQHLLYDTYENTFSSSDADTIQLIPNEQILKEVVVKGERPLVKVVEGRLTYDMPQLLEGKVVSNIYESLLQLPGVREQDGGLLLAGANGLSIIINGRPTTMSSEQLMSLLKTMPKEQLANAEVMYSAPPQYHVRGAAINLILAQATSDSPALQGQVNSEYSQYHYGDYMGGASLLYTTPRLATDILYSYNTVGNRNGIDLYSHHLYNGSEHNIEQHNRGNSRQYYHNIRIGNDFNPDDKNKISLVYTTKVEPKRHQEEQSIGTYSNSSNTKEADKPTQMHNVALNYTSGFGMSTGIDYTSFQNQATQHYTEAMQGREDVFEAKSKQDIDRISVYIDQSHPLRNDWKLHYGTKFMYASDQSSQTYQSLTGKDLSGNNSISNQKEYTSNLYGSFNKNYSEKLSFSIALTGEYYQYSDFEEWSLFPSFESTYIASPTHIVQMSISSDKVYPGYWEMISSVGYLNGYMEVHGNPSLRPYKNYNMHCSYILKGKYVFTGYINYNDDYFVQLPYQSPDKLSLIYQTTNFDYKQQVGFNAVVPFKRGNVLSSRFVFSGFYDRVQSSHFHNTSFFNDNVGFFSQLNNTIHISSNPNITMEVTGSYISKSIQGPSEISPLYKLDTSIKWISANNKAELGIKANDIFNSWSPDEWRMNIEGQNIRMHIVPDSRYISVSFTYKFGGYKEKQRKEIDTSRFNK